MKSALDKFEESLVHASRTLSASRDHSATAPEVVHRSAGRFRRLMAMLPAVPLLSAATALAAGGVAAALVFDDQGDTAKTLASFECMVSRQSSAGVPAITGDPVTDCAANWPSATAGRSSAPPLTAWAVPQRPLEALVQPTSWGRPAPVRVRTSRTTSYLEHWAKLPSNWTVNLGVVELSDQLQDISISPYGGPSCTYARSEERIVRSLLRADGLHSWRVVASPEPGRRATPVDPRACNFTIPFVEAGIHTVELSQIPLPAHAPHLSAKDRQEIAAGNATNQALAAVDLRVKAKLATRCESVSAAAALWTAAARARDFLPATLAYWRRVNGPGPNPPHFDRYYTFVKQPASQHTGNCAHVLVMRYGGGDLVVYVARIAV